MKRIACFGSGVMDILMKSEDFRVLKSHQVQGGVAICEVYGGKMEVEEMVMAVGGAGTNVAVGVARLGHAAACIARVGGDLLGKQIVNELSVEKIEHSMVQIDEGGRTGTSVVLVAADGGRSILTYRGVSKKVEAGLIDWQKVGRAEWIHLANMGGNLSLIEDIINFAAERRIPLSWNPGKDELKQRERVKNWLPKVEILIVNRLEAGVLLARNWEEGEEIARGLVRLGVKAAAVTEGKKGVSYIDGRRVIQVKAFRSKSVDDTGAGDGFSSGLISGLVEGREIEEALLMGVANGASVVRKLGAKAGLLRTKQMERWLAKKVEVTETAI